ncbi:arsenite efflux transporter metallochaperone ArsD [Clostridium oryzae]|uniref:Arsenical resistance operon trans-acting repressor ArsD n=1 Tax=Clostridium oryzae TaxID=1450648 RepID=A0A1V4IT04_9CLOT|nr:arsenite efflux transporter metallochaperone ArsD [Clostridium oryzae]OPJ62934.1 arsenical resistance operon trans-acting repressor ArsD [Clostridium oryzae]
MKKMIIFDPAMCCTTGVCGSSIDKELLRVATAINKLKDKGIIVERHNLANNPQIFIDNKIINELLNKSGIDVLPITMVDGEVVKTGAYPTNREFCSFFGLPEAYLKLTIKKPSKVKDCGCKGGCC